jgi:hypothetical protein
MVEPCAIIHAFVFFFFGEQHTLEIDSQIAQQFIKVVVLIIGSGKWFPLRTC